MTLLDHYDYSFQVWPDETWQWHEAVFDLFKMLKHRIVLTLTEPEFEAYRSGLARHGLTMREVERVPYYEPESVL